MRLHEYAFFGGQIIVNKNFYGQKVFNIMFDN